MIEKYTEQFDQAVDFYKKELSGVRTSRAQASMVENIHVEVYGAKTPLNQLASISVPEARTISIEPWDKTITKDIEKTLTTIVEGVTIQNDGNLVRVIIPMMTEETRKDVIKILGQKTEKAKVAIRQIREKVRDEILTQEKNKEITEDDRYDLQKELDDITSSYTKKIDGIKVNKEEEIMTV